VTPAPRRGLALIAAIWLVWSAWYAAWALGAPLGPAAIGYLALPAGAAIGSQTVYRLIRSVPLDPVARRFWRLMLASFVLLAAGYALLAVQAFRDLSVLPTMPIPAAVLVAAAFLIAMWGVARVPLGIANRVQRQRQWLDRSIAFFGCGSVLFTFGLGPMIKSPDWSVQTLVLLGLSFVLAIGGITKVSYIGGGPVDRVAIRLIGMMGMVGAGVALLAVTGGGDSIVPAQAVVMPIAPLLAAVAVRRQWASSGARPRRANTWLPYLAVAAVDVPLLAQLPHQDRKSVV